MSVHDGHRKRLIEKLSSGALLEHELLEALLFNAIPRRNTNDIAHRLLAAFGSIENIFNASMDALKSVSGVGESVASYLFCVGAFYKKMNENERARLEPKKWIREDFQTFVKQAYAGLEREVLDVYLLNSACEIIFKKRFSDEKSASVRIRPVEFSKLFSDERVNGMVMVHNHPFGDSNPSKQDDASTFQCRQICNFHNVMLCDHVIYSPSGVYSYYYSGRLKRIEAECLKQKENIEALWGELDGENE